jgi:hypothetical protein
MSMHDKMRHTLTESSRPEGECGEWSEEKGAWRGAPLRSKPPLRDAFKGVEGPTFRVTGLAT